MQQYSRIFIFQTSPGYGVCNTPNEWEIRSDLAKLLNVDTEMKECVEASGGEESFNNALAQSGLAEIEIENKLDKEKVEI